MKLIRLTVVFVLSILIGALESARILGVFPTPSISHQVVFHALVKDLAARGHHLTVLTTDLIKTQNPNVTQVNLHDSYEIFRQLTFVEVKENKVSEEDTIDLITNRITLQIIDKQLSQPEVKRIIQKADNQTFDIVIMEFYFLYTTVLAFAEVYDCPIIGITSLDALAMEHEHMGNTANALIHPVFFFGFNDGKLSFLERWRSLKYYLRSHYLIKDELDQQYSMQIRNHFPNVKASIEDMKKRIQFVMTNTSPALGFIRPLLPSTIQLGFMHIEPPKPLPNGALKTFLDNSENGVVYMSLGSNVNCKDLNPAALQIFVNAFGNVTLNVVWKFEADTLPNKPDNVMISKWLPQADLLAHPTVKLFITQGGQQSMEEAIDRTVPMIVIPFLGDQKSNAQRMVSKGIGYHLDLHSLTQTRLVEAINEMMKPTYKENIRNLKDLVNDQPMTSREKAVWWTEYVIRHKGANHLEYPGRAVPIYQKYAIDFIATGVVSALIIVKTLHVVFQTLLSFKKLKNE